MSLLHKYKRMLGDIELPKLLIAVSAFLLFFCLIFPIHSSAQTTYYSRTTGDWDVAATWSTAACGGVAAGFPPGTTDHAVICSGHTVTLGSGTTIDNLTINSGSVLNTVNKQMTVDGNLVVNGTYIANTAGGMSLNFTGGAGTTIDGSGVLDIQQKSFKINGNTTILSTADFELLSDIDIGAGVTVTNNGAVSSGVHIVGSNAASTWINASGSILFASGNLLITGILTASASNNTVHYNGAGNQTIKDPSSSTYYNLKVSGSGTKTLDTNIVVTNDLTINGVTLDCDTHNINIGGNWINSGAFDEQTATVTFDGSGAQSITNTLEETFYDLTINKPAGTLTLSNNVTVSDTLTMTAGNINTGSNRLTLGTSTANEGTLTYTAGQIIGEFERWIDNASTGIKYLFPVGTSGNYRPAEPNFSTITGAGGSLIAKFIESDPGNSGLSLTDAGITIYNTFVEGYWDLTEANSFNGTAYDLDLTGSGFTSFTINAATRLLTRANSGNDWIAEGTHVNAVGSTAKRTGLSTLSAQYSFGDSTNCSGPSTSSISSVSGNGNTVCTGDVEKYAVTFTSGNTYSWSATGEASITTNANGDTATVTWGSTGRTDGNVRVIETNSCTDGAPVDFSVVIHTIAPSSITGKKAIAANTTGEPYSVTNISGYTYTWTITGGTSDPNPASGQGTSSITVDWGGEGTGKVSVVADSGGCSSSSTVELNVTIYVIIESITTGDWPDATTWDCDCTPQPTDNVRIMNTHTVTLTNGSGTTIDNFIINSGGILSAPAKPFTVTGDFTVSGTYSGTSKTIILSGVDAVIDGTGAITLNAGTELSITSGSKSIAPTAVLELTQGDWAINTAGVIVTNNGNITIADNLIGTDGTVRWINADNSTLNVGGALLSTGILIASATGNTVRYYANGAQTVKTPNASTYYNLTVDSPGTKTTGAALTVSNDLTIASTALLSMGGNFDINGDLKISGTSQLDAANNNITLAGNWVNTSTDANPFVEGTGTVTFDGSADQVINNGSTNDERFYNFIINKSGGNVIPSTASDVVIANSLTFTKGIIRADSNSTTVEFIDNATSNGGDADSYVDGPVKKIGNDAFVFPIGDSTIWARIAITAPALATDAFTAQYFASKHVDANNTDATLNNSSVVEYWTLDRTAGVSGVQVTLFWEDSARSGIDDAATADLVVARYNGSNWVDVGQNSITNNDPGDVTSNVVTSFSPFTFASKGGPQNPLPIDLLYFDAVLNNRFTAQSDGTVKAVVDLTWATASETNNNYFTVEKSIDGTDFEFVTYISGAGNSSQILYYTAIDDEPYYGVSYYRLKQTDYDGRYEYSKVIAINYLLNENYNITVYPNPSDGSFNVNIKGNKNDKVLIVVADVLGREYYSKVIILDEDEYILTVDPYNKLPPGVYVITATSKNNLYWKRIVLH